MRIKKLRLVIATKNKKKLAEIRALLHGEPVILSSIDDFTKLPRIVENADTFEGNAVKKATVIARATGMLAIGEDSGLCIDALGGAPGVYSARFAGRSKDDMKNNTKVLRLMLAVPAARRTARYVRAIALADKNGLIGVCGGTCSGRIGYEPRGSRGFGYDPVFVIPRYGKSFAELGEKIKHTMSHRFKALQKAKKMIHKYVEQQQHG